MGISLIEVDNTVYVLRRAENKYYSYGWGKQYKLQ